MSDHQDSGISSPSQSRRSSTASSVSGDHSQSRAGRQGVARNPSQDRRRRGSSGQGHGQGIARNPAADRRHRPNRSASTARRSSMSRASSRVSSRARSTVGRSTTGRRGRQGVARNPAADRRRRPNRSTAGRSRTSTMSSRSTTSRARSTASRSRSSTGRRGRQGVARNPAADRRRRPNRSTAGRSRSRRSTMC